MSKIYLIIIESIILFRMVIFSHCRNQKCSPEYSFYEDIGSGCKSYFQCLNGQLLKKSCPPETSFNLENISCDFSSASYCSSNSLAIKKTTLTTKISMTHVHLSLTSSNPKSANFNNNYLISLQEF